MRPATLLSRALDVVFPPRCVDCGAFDAFICDSCLSSTKRANGPRCPRCWKLGHAANHCSAGGPGSQPDSGEARRAPAFEALRSTFVYDSPAGAAVRILKFHGVSAIAPTMAVLMNETLAEWSPPIDFIVPVPLGSVRKRTRGYNQSELLAREIARHAGLPIEPNALRRARATQPQTEQPDAAARWRNVAGAFATGKRPVSGRVLLIDDVTTTGATLDACARTLLNSGATQVYALTFARED